MDENNQESIQWSLKQKTSSILPLLWSINHQRLSLYAHLISAMESYTTTAFHQQWCSVRNLLLNWWRKLLYLSATIRWRRGVLWKLQNLSALQKMGFKCWCHFLLLVSFLLVHLLVKTPVILNICAQIAAYVGDRLLSICCSNEQVELPLHRTIVNSFHLPIHSTSHCSVWSSGF